MTDLEFDVARAFAEVAGDIANQPDVAGARAQILALAQQTLGSAGTAIWHLRPDSTMHLDACTDSEFMILMSDVTGQQPDGPAWQSLTDRRRTVVPDLEIEMRWPRHVRRVLAESPVRSAVVYPLGVAGRDLGVLAAYSEVSGHFRPPLVELGAVFAAHASLALENAILADKAHHLQRALESNRKIGVAMGILMSQRGLTEREAFDLLRIASQNTHRKLITVADDVVFTGTIETLRAS